MRVVFIEVDTELAWALASLGPAFLAGLLRQHGHEAELVRAAPDASVQEVLEQIREARPDLLAVSLTTRQWLRAKELIGYIRQHLDVPVVAGGLHPTFSPEQVLAANGFDVVCLGEGEGAMLDLVNALAGGTHVTDLPTIDNLMVPGGKRPRLRPPVSPVDDLPFAARDMLDEPVGVAHVNTQRGCPFPCTYCAARMYNELYEGTGADYGRRRSHDNVLEELVYLEAEERVRYIIFLDDTFTINHGWVKSFCARYREEVGLPFSLNARVETVNPKLIDTLADAGCKHIIYGVESGSERIRKQVLKRHATNQRFEDVFRWTKEAGIMVTANYMLGLPEETVDDMQQTLDLAKRLDAYDFGYFVFYPYPGTHLFRYCQAKGYLPDDYRGRPANHRESILNLKTISQSDIDRYWQLWTEYRASLYEARGGTGHAAYEHALVA